jgi:putative holliday junction resolvase
VRAVGIDLGETRIGVAVSAGSLATPYEVVQRTGDRQQDRRALAALVAEAEADVVVVGLPLSLDGSIGPAARAALVEVDALRDTLDVPVETYDERLTTVTADRQLKEQGLDAKARRRIVDKVAASILLQAWLDARSSDDRTSTDARGD